MSWVFTQTDVSQSTVQVTNTNQLCGFFFKRLVSFFAIDLRFDLLWFRRIILRLSFWGVIRQKAWEPLMEED